MLPTQPGTFDDLAGGDTSRDLGRQDLDGHGVSSSRSIDFLTAFTVRSIRETMEMATNAALGGGGGAGGQVVLHGRSGLWNGCSDTHSLGLAGSSAVAEIDRAVDPDLTVLLGWFVPVAEGLSQLPWGQDAWSSEGAHPLNDGAVVRLLLLLQELLPANGPAPIISPTWDGDVPADWELGDLYLEVEIVPNGVTRCCFVDERGDKTCDEQFELSGRETELRRYMGILSDHPETLQGVVGDRVRR